MSSVKADNRAVPPGAISRADRELSEIESVTSKPSKMTNIQQEDESNYSEGSYYDEEEILYDSEQDDIKAEENEVAFSKVFNKNTVPMSSSAAKPKHAIASTVVK